MKRLTEFFSLTCPRRPAEWVSCDLIKGKWGKRTGYIPFDRSSNPELANVPADMLVHVVKQKGEEAPPRSLPPVERTSVEWLFHRELARVLVHADDRAVVVTPTVVVDPEEQCLYDSHCVVEFTHAIQGEGDELLPRLERNPLPLAGRSIFVWHPYGILVVHEEVMRALEDAGFALRFSPWRDLLDAPDD